MNAGEGIGIGLVALICGAVWLLLRPRPVAYSDKGEQAGKVEPHDMVTDESVQITQHFRAREFRCRCNRCTSFKISLSLVIILEALRNGISEITGSATPISILSGYRCPEWNAKKDGAINSCHMAGLAVDLAIPQRMQASVFHGFMYVFWYKAKRGGLGLYDWGVHVDQGPAGRLWDQRRNKVPIG